MAGQVLLEDPAYRELMQGHACEWRVESGSLPGVSVGDLVEIDIADDEFTFTKTGGVRVASVPIASTQSERNNISNWVELLNRDAGVSVWLSPSDKFVKAWIAARSGEGQGRAVGAPKT